MIYNAKANLLNAKPNKVVPSTQPLRNHSWWWRYSWTVKAIVGVISLAIAVIVGGYVVGILQFQENHYNAKMIINGVKVGRMTVAQASEAIQEQGITGYVIDQGQLRTKHTPNQQVITQRKLKQLLKQQYSIWPSQRKYQYTSTGLLEQQVALQEFAKEKIDVTVNGQSMTIKSNQVFDQVTYNPGSSEFNYDDTKLSNWISKLNQRVKARGKSYQLILPNHQNLTVKNVDYGWQLNTDNTVADIESTFDQNQGNQTINLTDNITGNGRGVTDNHGLGKDYLLYSMSENKLIIVKDNQVVSTIDNLTFSGEKPNDNQGWVYTWGSSNSHGRFIFTDDQKKQITTNVKTGEPIIVYTGKID